MIFKTVLVLLVNSYDMLMLSVKCGKIKDNREGVSEKFRSDLNAHISQVTVSTELKISNCQIMKTG